VRHELIRLFLLDEVSEGDDGGLVHCACIPNFDDFQSGLTDVFPFGGEFSATYCANVVDLLRQTTRFERDFAQKNSTNSVFT